MNTQIRINTIKPIVKGLEDIQKIRIATGNRIAANFLRRHGGMAPCENTFAFKTVEELEEMSPEDQATYKAQAEAKEALKEQLEGALQKLKAEYMRITDAVVAGEAEYILSKLPKPKSFKPTELIGSYAELVLIDQYVKLLNNEKETSAMLEASMANIPLYRDYLKKVDGVGPKLAAVIISELDPHKAKYASSYWKYTGLDTVIVGKYTKSDGKEGKIGWLDICEYYSTHDFNAAMVYDGRDVEFTTIGRNRHKASQVYHEYISKEGKRETRLGISFNPYLKTKLVGVLSLSMLKATRVFVDGVKVTNADRVALAKDNGWASKRKTPDMKEVDAFLRTKGYDVVRGENRFSQVYRDYKHRIENSIKPEHQGLTPAHIHAMALRYMIKEFLRELHIVSRHTEGLPIYQSYEQAKLGYSHKQNEFLMSEFGIDTTKFEVDSEQQAELPLTQMYPKVIADYIRMRSMACKTLKT